MDPIEPGATSIAVCALTYHRPVGLDALLAGLADLEGVGPPIDVRVVLVDNDPAGSGREVVEAWRDRLPWPITYEVEARRGIPFGRNRALAAAGEVDLVAFLDDDEVPDRRWLAELLAVHRSTGAPIVTGAVLGTFASDPPGWATAGGFFTRHRRPTGTTMQWARTSNVLIAHEVYAGRDAPFNEAMGLSGGDDTHFFLRARLEGHRIVWADDAVVSEEVPASRVSVGWLLRREYRRGNTLSLCLRDLQDSPVRRARRGAQGVLRILQGLALLVAAPVRGRVGAIEAVLRVAFGAGLLTGLLGVRYDEYTVVHGR